MWEQYAGKASGVCIIFSKKSVLTQIKNQLELNFKADYIGYTRQYFKSMKGIATHQSITCRVKSYFENKLFLKHFDYRDENEYRIITYIKSNDHIFLDIKNSLKGVILGVNLQDEIIQDYKNILKNYVHNEHKPYLLKARFSDTLPFYHYERINF